MLVSFIRIVHCSVRTVDRSPQLAVCAVRVVRHRMYAIATYSCTSSSHIAATLSGTNQSIRLSTRNKYAAPVSRVGDQRPREDRGWVRGALKHTHRSRPRDTPEVPPKFDDQVSEVASGMQVPSSPELRGRYRALL